MQLEHFTSVYPFKLRLNIIYETYLTVLYFKNMVNSTLKK